MNRWWIGETADQQRITFQAPAPLQQARGLVFKKAYGPFNSALAARYAKYRLQNEEMREIFAAAIEIAAAADSSPEWVAIREEYEYEEILAQDRECA